MVAGGRGVARAPRGGGGAGRGGGAAWCVGGARVGGWSAGAARPGCRSPALRSARRRWSRPVTLSPTDPKWLSTLDALAHDLVSDSLVYRYDPKVSPDGLRGAEGTFSICSFWYVEALSRAGRLDEARLAFEKMLTYANHVGLFAEQ